MSVWKSPIVALYEEVKEIHAAAGLTVPHLKGIRKNFSQGNPPRYVWIATRIRDSRESPTRRVDQHRSLFTSNLHVDIYCWGRDEDECWALWTNLNAAIVRAFEADMVPEGGRWEHFGEGNTQKGEILVCEISLCVPTIDAFVPIAPAAADPSVEEPERHTVQPTQFDTDVYKSPDPEHDGELALTVTTNP